MFQEHQEILITTIVGVMLVLFLVSVFILSIIRYKHRVAEDLKEKLAMQKNFEQTLLQAQIEVQESTFSTLSKELHDNIGQLMSTAKMLLGITERNLPNPPDTLITANATVGQAINELRSLSKSLNKEWLEQFDLIENLVAEVERVGSAKSIKIDLEHTGKLSIKANEQIILFRIIQEAIQNAIRHSFASNIDIRISLHNHVLSTIVKDNGKGFEQKETMDGVGILNMKQRTKLLGGTIEWKSSDKGSTVFIILPVKPDEV